MISCSKSQKTEGKSPDAGCVRVLRARGVLWLKLVLSLPAAEAEGGKQDRSYCPSWALSRVVFPVLLVKRVRDLTVTPSGSLTASGGSWPLRSVLGDTTVLGYKQPSSPGVTEAPNQGKSPPKQVTTGRTEAPSKENTHVPWCFFSYKITNLTSSCPQRPSFQIPTSVLFLVRLKGALHPLLPVGVCWWTPHWGVGHALCPFIRF